MNNHRIVRLATTNPKGSTRSDQATGAPLRPTPIDARNGAQAQGLLLAALGQNSEAATALGLLELEHALLRAVVEKLPHGLCVFDVQDRLLLANRRCTDLWQLKPEQMRAGTPLSEILAGMQASEMRFGASVLTQRGAWLMDDGRRIGVTVSKLTGGSWMARLEDVTKQWHSDEQVAHLARHDELTGLPKVALLCAEVTRLLARSDTVNGLAVICLDLDRFKTVIDQFGHSAADDVLRQAACRLRGCARQNDMIVRAGGDEFVVLQHGAEQPAAANALAQRMMAALAQPFEVNKRQAHVSASVGVALAPFDGKDAETLLRNAALAMGHAKAGLSGKLCFFEPEMDTRAQARLTLESDLRQAVAEQSLHLHYQPKVNLATGRVRGVEALARWEHPTRGNVSPLDFIPMAEETGLIVAIGRWVLSRACADALLWPPEVHVAVNVSVLQFRRGTLLRDVAQALRDSGLPATRLEIEITETVMMEDAAQAIEVLNDLRRLGVRVAMDDFGTGYSSLSYLRSFPFDRIKIDRSFVRDVGTHAGARSIVSAIAGLGRSLGMAVTAEGVETLAQLDAVRNEGCDEVQGYLFSRPRPACDIPALIESVAAVCTSLGRKCQTGV